MRHTKKAHRRGRRHRAVVLIMVLGILATMTIVATAFLLFMRQSYRAATNTQFAARAELACRSGLEHAIRAISFALDGYTVTPDGALDSHDEFFDDPTGTAPNGSPVGPGAGWYKYFEGATEIVRYTDSGDPKPHVITGRTFRVGSPTVQMEYAIQVYDLDGRLHANIAKWSWGLGVGGSGTTVDQVELIEDAAEKCASISGAAADVLKLDAEEGDTRFSCMSEIARRAGVGTQADGKYRLERFFTVYPFIRDSKRVSGGNPVVLEQGGLQPDELANGWAVFEASARALRILANTDDSISLDEDWEAADGDEIALFPRRPSADVNTVPEALLVELVEPICSFYSLGNLSRSLACYLVARRPFTNRHEFEEAVRRVAGDDAVDDLGKVEYDPGDNVPDNTHLSERQFNDLLNSTAGFLAEGDSTYDEPGCPGLYSFDGWPPFDGTDGDDSGPAQTGGDHTDPYDTTDDKTWVTHETGNLTHNVTWSTEFKFTSRFFHIYVLGRGINPDSGRPRGVRRLHAIYDAEADRILWLRWNISRRGSVVDIIP